MNDNTILVTGGAGFIGSEVVRRLARNPDMRVVTVDALSYAGHLESLAEVEPSPNHRFVEGDIGDIEKMADLFVEERPRAVLHLAAETHVDRSIDGPEAFIRTNVLGTQRLLDASRHYHSKLGSDDQKRFRFLHVSTDEVYGSLGPHDPAFTEDSPYRPRSPYAASKAGADHVARAYHHTYGLPVVVTNCSNNFGPYQFPEKLIPLTVLRALNKEPVPVYGDGSNVRDWLHVEDHVSGLFRVLDLGRPGETYLIGGENERSNLEVVRSVLSAMNDLVPTGDDYTRLIEFVPDRPGHDFRYAVDATKLRSKLGWRPERSFEEGILDTVRWYLHHRAWCEAVTDGRYDLGRLGRLA